MALSMLDKTTDHADKSAWPPAIATEFEREKQTNNGCVGSALLSETERGGSGINPARSGRADRLSSPRARLLLDLGDRGPRPPAHP